MSPLLAHAGHQAGGGLNVPLLVAAGAVFVLAALLLRVVRTKPMLSIGALAVAGALVTGSFLVGGGAGTRSATAFVRIDRPADGAEVQSGSPVVVEVKVFGARIARTPTDTNGGHLHLYVDGKLQQMPYSKRAEVQLDPGRHTLTVELVDSRHLSFDPAVSASVRVTAA